MFYTQSSIGKGNVLGRAKEEETIFDKDKEN